MACGFSAKTFEYFMALSFNNNRDFFHSTHDWYEESVRAPLKQLCAEMSETLLSIDPEMEVRPAHCISHINRDLRYSRDKSPYRDYMWMGFHRAFEDKQRCFSFYFDIGAEGANVGAGLYSDDRQWTGALREFIRREPERAREILLSPKLFAFHLYGSEYKRIEIPESVEKPLHVWYVKKGLYLQHAYDAQELLSEKFLADVNARLTELKDVYNLMMELRPVSDNDPDDVQDAKSFYTSFTNAGFTREEW